jgi:hypothetical protein
MEFIECTNDDFIKFYKEKSLTLSTWDLTKTGLDFPSESDMALYKITLYDDVVALIELSKGMHENSILIHNFEVFEKGKGRGSMIINKLKKELKGITIYLYSSSSESYSFWKKHDFEGNSLLRYPK